MSLFTVDNVKNSNNHPQKLDAQQWTRYWNE